MTDFEQLCNDTTMRECQAMIRFDVSKIPLSDLEKIEEIFHKNGIWFDCAYGRSSRDWEFGGDAIKGPVKVYFRKFSE